MTDWTLDMTYFPEKRHSIACDLSQKISSTDINGENLSSRPSLTAASPVRRHSTSGDLTDITTRWEAPCDMVTIVIWHFKLNPGSPLLWNRDISNLVVQYRFLDVPLEETETPYSAQKPMRPDQVAAYDFAKVFHIDGNAAFRKLGSSIHHEFSGGTRSAKYKKTVYGQDNLQTISFCVLNEPHDLATAEECHPVGVACVCLRELWQKGSDLDEENIPVTAFDDRRILVGYLNVTVKVMKALQTKVALCKSTRNILDESSSDSASD